MVIRQYLNNHNGKNQISMSNKSIDFTGGDSDHGAYRIAFQALPGTKFTLNSPDGEVGTEIEMGPTGIYELGFSRPIIKNFKLISTPDSQSLMMLDVLLSDGNDQVAGLEYDETDDHYLQLIADSYDKDEGSMVLNPDVDNYNLFWNVSGRNLNY